MLVRKPFALNAAAAEMDADKVEKKSTAEEQYLYALVSGSESAWKSVGEYFPADKFPRDANYVSGANQQLARYYLLHDNYGTALKLFEQFANYDEVERKFKAFGLAGECVIYSLQGNQKESAKVSLKLSEVSGGLEPAKLDALLDRQMVRNVGYACGKT